MAAVRTAISVDKDLFDEINSLSVKIKLSRSQIFAQAARYFIEKKKNLELVRRINQAYADVLDDEEKTVLEKSKKAYKRVIEGTW